MFPLHSQKGPYTLNQIEMSQSRPLARPSVPARGRTSLLGPTGRMDPSPRGKAGGREREKKKSTLYKYHHKRRASLSPKVRRRGQINKKSLSYLHPGCPSARCP